jgi:hypothetical protein
MKKILFMMAMAIMVSCGCKTTQTDVVEGIDSTSVECVTDSVAESVVDSLDVVLSDSLNTDSI